MSQREPHHKKKRGAYDDEFKQYDSDENIQMCLACVRPTCVNCIADMPKASFNRRLRLTWIPPFDIELLANARGDKCQWQEMYKLYRFGYNDKEIAEQLLGSADDVQAIYQRRRRAGWKALPHAEQEYRKYVYEKYGEERFDEICAKETPDYRP